MVSICCIFYVCLISDENNIVYVNYISENRKDERNKYKSSFFFYWL